jgi:Na+/phosphate symporter
MNQVFSILIIVGGGLGTFLLGMKHLSEGLQAVSGSGLRRFISLATTQVRVLAELDILNAYERIRSCYINMAETLAGRK